MAVKAEIESQVDAILKTRWDVKDGYVVPDAADISLGNYGRNLDACVHYADLADAVRIRL